MLLGCFEWCVFHATQKTCSSESLFISTELHVKYVFVEFNAILPVATVLSSWIAFEVNSFSRSSGKTWCWYFFKQQLMPFTDIWWKWIAITKCHSAHGCCSMLVLQSQFWLFACHCRFLYLCIPPYLDLIRLLLIFQLPLPIVSCLVIICHCMRKPWSDLLLLHIKEVVKNILSILQESRSGPASCRFSWICSSF